MTIIDWMYGWLMFSAGASLLMLALACLVAAYGYAWGTPDDDELDQETLSLEEVIRMEKGEEDE